MDGWQTAQNWSIFGVVVVGLACYYYYPQLNKQTPKLAPPKDVKKEVKSEVKKAARKVESAAKKQTRSIPAAEPKKSEASSKGNGKNKRKADPKPAQQAPVAQVNEQEDDDAIVMSTLQFAANMKKAREGVDMKKTDSKETRVKTVKTKTTDSPNLSSGSPHMDDGDTENQNEWSQVASPALRSSGIDDMLEPSAPGPNSLRITAPSKPIKEKVNKQPKQVVTETKKQRQNRQKKENERLAREEAEGVRKVQQEQQRRTAREGRGEAARNGIPIPAAPADNPWSEQNAAREVQLPVKAGDNAQLLDTFDVESTGSSNADRMSTAATSTTDGPNEQSEQGAYDHAIEESGRDSGWNEVKSNKKTKKSNQGEAAGQTTPIAAPVAKKAAPKPLSNGKPVGFQALKDEYESRSDHTEVPDPSDVDNWAA